jgi:hypothetical protein
MKSGDESRRIVICGQNPSQLKLSNIERNLQKERKKKKHKDVEKNGKDGERKKKSIRERAIN